MNDETILREQWKDVSERLRDFMGREEKRLEEEQLNIEIKRQKILALKRKIFPWMKK